MDTKKTTFNQVLRKSLSDYYFPGSQVNEERQLLNTWYSYHISGLKRGRDVAKSFSKLVNLKGKHMLEIGCGCGGLSIAFSEKGCITTGIDNNSTLPNLIDFHHSYHTSPIAFGVWFYLEFLLFFGLLKIHYIIYLLDLLFSLL